MFAQFLLDFSKQKVRFAQVLAFSKVAKTEGEVFVALWASLGELEPSRATISPQSPCSLTPAFMKAFSWTPIPIICIFGYSGIHVLGFEEKNPAHWVFFFFGLTEFLFNTNSTDDKLMIFVWFFLENRIWHIMQIVS